MKLFILLASLCLTLHIVSSSLQQYQAIFNFGDSLSDTGNLLLSDPRAPPDVIGKLPYGETFFHHATGRFSDGRLIVDFIAEASGLPHLPPYLALKKGQNFYQGVNFAVAGATALDPEFFYRRKMSSILATNYSLSTQLGWFKELKPSLCNTKQECENYFKKALFLVGEIGGNDYNYAFFVGGSIKQLKASVPLVVDAITKATGALIEEGAVELVVPGNLPIGCSAVYLTLYGGPNKAYYEKRNGCLKAFNAFAKHHNKELKRALGTLEEKYPHARIIYADYYGASMPFYHAPQHYGFTSGSLAACCGGGGPYNFNNSARCGHIGSKACKDPSSYANWDGLHLTEAAYSHIAKGMIHGNFTAPI
ncbi:putative sinapine esterase [Rosa chinensis]|uniref:Putative sinapine esterase n=1 Tax=Rosa chinensis TaxID=74649 RepID=A0A2P6Q4L2_ROSCH|nr:GDSL esterase/lipase At5g45910 [Rosa chinensis]PRQ29106.1 putative sinapine esterase [Rosa chinensis]